MVEEKEANKPLSIVRRILTPDKNIHALAVTLKNVPGALMQVLNVMYKYEINIIGVIGCSLKKGDSYGTAFLVIDSTKSNKSYDEILNEISEQPLVMKVFNLERPIPLLVLDNYHYPLIIFDNMKAYILTQPFIDRFITGSIEIFGMDAALSLFWHIGKSIGHDLFKTWMNYGVKKEEIPIAILYTGQALGIWKGNLRYNLDNKTAELILSDNLECDNKKKYKAKSYFIRGIWEAIFEGLFEIKVVLNETKCISLGDEFCEFKFSQNF